MEHAIFNVFLYMNDPRSLPLVCKSWSDSLRREQEDSISGIFRRINTSSSIHENESVYEKVRILIENNRYTDVHLLVHYGFLPVQWRWYILSIRDTRMVNILRPVIGTILADITICIIEKKVYNRNDGPMWLTHLTSAGRWSKLAYHIYKDDVIAANLLLTSDINMINILNKDYMSIMKSYRSDINSIFLIHYLVDRIGSEDMKSLFKTRRITIRPFEPTNGIIPAKNEYPWPIDKNNINDLIEYDRSDLLHIGYGMTKEEQVNGDEGICSFIKRIKKILNRPYAISIDKSALRRSYYVREWVKYMEETYSSL